MSNFQTILNNIRKSAFSEFDKGHKFERLMQAYLQTDPLYAPRFQKVWLWEEFPARKDFGGKDSGIDLVALTHEGDYWAVQCKCFSETAQIDKGDIDSFLSTSSREFKNENFETVRFTHRLWIDTTKRPFGINAEEAIQNQNPPVSRLSLYQLRESPVDWELLEKGVFGDKARIPKKSPRAHQFEAIQATHQHFGTHERGKLIMACGTGKTFTSLKIAERETEGKGLILFMVPSIALLGQTLREWTAEANEPINAICICSDSGVSQKRSKNEDTSGFSTVDLALPASTDVKKIVSQFQEFRRSPKGGMTVVFSTYQSIDVIAKAQQALLKAENGYGIFDLIICDEAHRTTGVTIADTDESAFVKVHNDKFIQSKKRVYMTATPRLYNEDSVSKAVQANAVLCSMDDPTIYGEEMYRIGFGKAVKDGLLSDYKVLVLTISESDMAAALQRSVSKDGYEINSDDASKLIGCINALSKQILGDAGILKESDPEPMRRAVAFCQNIKTSKTISHGFGETRNIAYEKLPPEKRENLVTIASEHVDGSMSAPFREEKISWLKAVPEDGKECRILTNARCLSEGVDIPSLDAVLFLSARNSQVDVVQSVGRVMRLAPNKKYGYIIIPVVVPTTVEPEKALDNNDRYRVVWTVLNALRAHDDRFNAEINKIELNKNKSGRILVGTADNGSGKKSDTDKAANELAQQLAIQFEAIQNVVFAKMVQKVGDRRYWEQWAKDVAKIAERYVERINRLIREDKEHQKVFAAFLAGLQKNINPSITQGEAVDMLAQHIITKPVFEALFEGYSFVKNNPISISMQTMLDLLEDQKLENDVETLEKFYESVKSRASGIDNSEGKQKIIVELYDKFFKSAFPKMVEQLGIVYTPLEAVDFIIHSVNDILKKEFDRTLSDENVHLLDPFTGTGTFMTRLLQSGLIKTEDLARKYTKELHANEIVLLAYYIAAINIENAYHDLTGEESEYQAFEGICLTDTFQLGENEHKPNLKNLHEMFPENSERVLAQKKAPLRVIMGNPPYSVGQKSANDNAQNQSYPKLDSRIAATYAKETDATNKNSLYDSYIKAFRWSSDRLDKDGGIIAFISNGAWLDGNATAGFRKSLQKEFSAIYVFNLRGNQRTSGELSRKEGGKIFGSGSRTPIAITFLVKKPDSQADKAVIHYHDIGDYLDQKQKLSIIKKFRTVNSPKMEWQTLEPNEHGDWISVRNDVFGTFISLGDKDDKNNKSTFFVPLYSNGVKTNRDAWVYNFGLQSVRRNVQRSIDFYNDQLDLFQAAFQINQELIVEDFINNDETKISWSRALRNDIARNRRYTYDDKNIIKAAYRPYFKQYLYFHREIINDVALIPKLFPTSNTKNLVICVSGVGVTKEFSAIITDTLPDLELIGKSQCFPLYYYEEKIIAQTNLFEKAGVNYVRRDGVSDFILKQARERYGNMVSKEDIFYYVYGFLHSPEYRETFSADLKKMLPRLPMVQETKDFWAFSKAGRKLAELHINYETVAAAEGVEVKGAESGHFRVEKMRFPSKEDKSSIIYNSKITIENIPAETYEYIVNGKSAIEWILERYQVTTHKDSGIKNDPNDWADEVGNPRYILDLILSVIRVSVETVAIVKGLPRVKFE
jgi:predicted helicase